MTYKDLLICVIRGDLDDASLQLDSDGDLSLEVEMDEDMFEDGVADITQDELKTLDNIVQEMEKVSPLAGCLELFRSSPHLTIDQGAIEKLKTEGHWTDELESIHRTRNN